MRCRRDVCMVCCTINVFTGMEIIKSLFAALANFIRRNPLTVLFLAIIAVGAPWVLGVFALILLVPLLIGAISLVPLIRSMREAQRAAAEQQRRYGGASYSRGRRRDDRREGDVTVVATEEPAPKRVSDDVGEYVDFKEVE